MNILGVVTVPLGDRVVTLPIVSFPYANLDAARKPGGLFIDDAGNVAIAVDGRASMPSIQQSAIDGAIEVAEAFLGMN